LPFFTFSPGEQQVVGHKYILELADRVKRAVTLTDREDEQLLGNVYLKVTRDASVCKVIAEEGYDEDLGARSLITAVRHSIEEVLVEAYLDLDEEISETQQMMDYVITAMRGEISVRLIPAGIGLGSYSEDGQSFQSLDDGEPSPPYAGERVDT
jgi:hypothetical protein